MSYDYPSIGLGLSSVEREELVGLKEKFHNFLKGFKRGDGSYKYMDRLREALSQGSKSIVLDFQDLNVYDRSLARLVIEKPRESLEALSTAATEVATRIAPDIMVEIGRLNVRIRGLLRSVKIRELRSEHVGKLVQVEGILVRSTPVRQYLDLAVFTCTSCGKEYYKKQEGIILEPPDQPCECGKTNYKLVVEKSKYIDWQKIFIQERPEETPSGQLPRSIEGILRGDLVDVARPGDRASVVGILKVVEDRVMRRGSKIIFQPVLEVVNVEVSQKALEEIEISKEDEEKILKLARDPMIHLKIVNSIAPTLYGIEDQKKAIALALFGGVPKIAPDGTRIRGDIHVLLIGDPGTGKSMLLQYISRIAPRGIYTTGKGATAAGLTAAVVRDKRTGEFYLEAGALVLADGGIACIDEIDKMREEDRTAIHEALEQQSYHKDFEILLADGRKVKIGELVDTLIDKYRDRVVLGRDTEILPVDDLYVIAYDPNFKRTVIVKADRVSRHKAPTKFVKIRFSNGRTITVTPEHPVVVWANGRLTTISASDVKEGMVVPGVRFYNFKGYSLRVDKTSTFNYKRVSSDLAELIGFILSSSSTHISLYNGHCEVRFSRVNPEFILEFKQLLKRIGLEHTEVLQDTSIEGEESSCIVRVESKRLCKDLKEYFSEFMSGEGEFEIPKRIPPRIFRAPKSVKKILLNVLFRKYGFISRGRVGFSTSSLKLAEDIQDLLLTLSIYSYLSSEESKTGRLLCKVLISGVESLSRFIEVITGDPRYYKVVEILERLKSRESCYYDLPLKAIVKSKKQLNRLSITSGRRSMDEGEFREYVEESGSRVRVLRASLQHDRVGVVRRFTRVSRALKEFDIPCSALKYKLLGKSIVRSGLLIISGGGTRASKLEEFVEEPRERPYGNIRLLRVESVEVLENNDSEWVYDVTVEPYHLFVSHGLVLHNTVSIAKAGIVARLNSRCSVIAAGNPTFGRYIDERPVTENINLPVTILSRFDLIFVLRDKPQPSLDSETADHILRVHRDIGKVKPEIDPDLLRKYISYARRFVKPKINEEAIDRLKKFYVDMRRKSAENPEIPIAITARQLEALIRLAEAHARMALRSEVTLEDAEEAIRLMRVFLEDVGIDKATGRIDIDTIMTGKPRSQQAKLSHLVSIISEMQAESGSVKVRDVINRAVSEGLEREWVESALKTLRREGTVYEPRPGYISIVK